MVNCESSTTGTERGVRGGGHPYLSDRASIKAPWCRQKIQILQLVGLSDSLRRPSHLQAP